MIKKLYILRHAETDYNRLGIVQGSSIDIPLNEYGRAQALAFYKKYSSLPFDLIISSTLRRSYETLSPFNKGDIPFRQDPRINEISWGTHEGKPTSAAMVETYKEMITDWRNGRTDSHLPKGESATSLYRRLNSFLDELSLRPESNILICTHGRTIRCLMTIFRDEHPREMEKYNHHNTGLFIIQQQNNEYKVLAENDHSHLNLLG